MRKLSIVFLLALVLMIPLVQEAEAIEWDRGITFFDSLYCQLIGCTMTGDLIIGNTNISIDGSVGIGTLSPLTEVHIVNDSSGLSIVTLESGADSVSQINLGDVNSVDTGRIRYENTGDKLEVWTNSAERLSIDSSGNVGIGTASPTNALQIGDGSGSVNLSLDKSAAGIAKIDFLAATGSGFGSIESDANEDLVFKVRNLDEFFFKDVDDTILMKIEGDGNVGIGTSGPSSRLHVFNGDVNFSDGTATTGFFFEDATKFVGIGVDDPGFTLDIQDSSFIPLRSTVIGTVFNHTLLLRNEGNAGADRGTGILFQVPSAGSSVVGGNIEVREVSNDANTYMVFSTLTSDSLTEKVRIDESGNVGIGTTNPTHKLNVDGTSNFTGSLLVEKESSPTINVRDTTNSANILMQAIDSFGVFGMSTNHDLRFRTNNVNVMAIENDGDVGIAVLDPTHKLNVDGDLNITGDALFESDINIGGANGYNDGGITLTSTGDGRFAGDILLDGTILSGNFLEVNTSIVCDLDNVCDLGNSSNRFKTLYAVAGIFNDTLDVDEGLLFVDGTNVGIQTSTPTADLHIVGGTNAEMLFEVNSVDGIITLGRNSASRIGELRFQTAGAATWYLGQTQSDVSGNGGDFFIGENAGGSSANLWLEEGGNIGIGTEAPAELLHLEGSGTGTSSPTMMINGTNTRSSARIRLQRGDSGLDDATIWFDTFGSESDVNFVFGIPYNGGGATNNLAVMNGTRDQGSSIMTFTPTLDIGIGDNSPSARMEIQGSRLDEVLLIEQNFNDEAVFIDNNGNGTGLFVDCDGGGICFEADGGVARDANRYLLHLDDNAQDNIRPTFWLDSESTTGDVVVWTADTTGDILQIKNESAGTLVVVDGQGQMGLGDPTPNGLMHLKRNVADNTPLLRLDTFSGGSATLTQGIFINHEAGGNGLRIDDVLSDTTPFVVGPAGNVGIGIEVPTQKLHVEGVSNFTNNVHIERGSGGTGITLETSGANAPIINWVNSAGNLTIMVDSTPRLVFRNGISGTENILFMDRIGGQNTLTFAASGFIETASGSNGNITFLPSGVGFTIIGDATTVPSWLGEDNNDDILITGESETDGDAFFDGVIEARNTAGASAINIRPSGSTYFSILPEADDGIQFTPVATEGRANNNLILTTQTNAGKDHDHDVSSIDPTWFIHSSTDPDQDNSRWLGLNFAGNTTGNITTGSGNLTFGPADGYINMGFGNALFQNSTCTILFSPSGTSRTEVCD